MLSTDALKAAALFRDLSDPELAEVMRMGEVKTHPEDSVILEEGMRGGALHVILTGEVRITKDVSGAGEEALTILLPGDVFGEIEFFDGSPASARVAAHSTCDTFVLPHGQATRLMETHPAISAKFLWALGRTLAARLRDTNDRMAGVLSISREF